jgi:hypothetical protein
MGSANHYIPLSEPILAPLKSAEQEFQRLKIGDKIELKYAYYPGVLWGVSGDIRASW